MSPTLAVSGTLTRGFDMGGILCGVPQSYASDY
jgi:hypothetical protein